MHPIYQTLPAAVLERYADAIEKPRLVILARNLARARQVWTVLGFPTSLFHTMTLTQALQNWPGRDKTPLPRTIVSEEVEPHMIRGADYLVHVQRRPGVPMLWVDITGSDHEPRSGLLRRLRAGMVGPRQAY